MYAANDIARALAGGICGLLLSAGVWPAAADAGSGSRGVALASAGAAGEPSPLVRQALARALSDPAARIDSAVEERAVARAPSSSSPCRVVEAEVPRAIDGSGRVAVRLDGQKIGGASCQAWTWVRVRVVADVSVSTRALRAGEPLDGAVTTEERELRAGHTPARIGPQAVAARAIASGQVLEADQVTRPTARLGESLKVLVVAGALVIEETGRAVPCVRGRTCALLPSGRRVEGDFIDGQLIVESP